MMKSSSIAAGVLCLVAASGAQAQSATVTITGELSAPTCVIEVNSSGGTSGSANGTVNLPSVMVTELSGAGMRAGRRPWNVVVGTSAAPCAVASVQIGFRNAGNVNAQGRLRNTATVGPATNVEIVISNIQGGGTARDINLTTNANSQVVTMPGSGVATLNFAAEYYATARTRQGQLTTSVQFDIIYP